MGVFANRLTGFFLFLFCAQLVEAQNKILRADSVHIHVLDSITISSSLRLNHQTYLKSVEDLNIYAGKKTNNIVLDPAKSNLAGNVSRTIFSQVPGIVLWDMSGTGTQVNIGSRGTDAHRSIEMNVRQNGYNINSDVFGYPEAHYTPAMQGVQKIELVRGSAALQFGPQFGGMFNYVMKDGDTAKRFSLETEQTIGSFGFFNSFNAVGGKSGRVRYYAYFDYRNGDGWRKYSNFNYKGYYANIKYELKENMSIALQFSRMDYREQIAGGLTDDQFNKDARTSLRSRNFFSPEINVPALIYKYRISGQSRLQVTSHYLNGQRNSVQFLNPPTIPDTINLTTNTFNPRQVDRDYYDGFTTEARFLHSYQSGKYKNTLSAGLRFYDQTTIRKQKGVGTTGSDYDLSLTKPYGIDLKLHSTNVAAFAEHIFQLTDQLSVIPGLRYEFIKTKTSGVINNAADNISYSGKRCFPLGGVGMQYDLTHQMQLYANLSQAYRPFLYANVTPADRLDVIDPELKDSKGYDIDIGYRGQVENFLRFDVNAYRVFYGNRVGQIVAKNEVGNNYLLTTNVGDAVSAGVEAFVSLSFSRFFLEGYHSGALYKLRLFNSFSYVHARYLSTQVSSAGNNINLKGKHMDNTPEFTNRTGLAWQHKAFLSQVTYTYSGKSFSDANNTAFNSSGVTGIISSYSVWDFSFNWAFYGNLFISAGINNVFDKMYFSRRISMYPGPGILPADGRSGYVSIGARL